MSLLYTGTVKLLPPPEFAGSKAEVNRESTASSAVLPPGSHDHLLWLLILATLGLCRQSSEVRGDREGTQEKLTQGLSPPTWNLTTECLLQTLHKYSSQGRGGNILHLLQDFRLFQTPEPTIQPGLLCPSQEELEATGVWAKLAFEGLGGNEHGLPALCSQPLK